MKICQASMGQCIQLICGFSENIIRSSVHGHFFHTGQTIMNHSKNAENLSAVQTKRVAAKKMQSGITINHKPKEFNFPGDLRHRKNSKCIFRKIAEFTFSITASGCNFQKSAFALQRRWINGIAAVKLRENFFTGHDFSSPFVFTVSQGSREYNIYYCRPI